MRETPKRVAATSLDRPLCDEVTDTVLEARMGVTKRHLLEELDRPALKPLPLEPYIFPEWRVRTHSSISPHRRET
ncbi:MAG TPA: hypothetical protein PLC74_10100 [Acetobacteraceae bacterium]|nr:hypothetical protein [Acetobacteraceae bacterium]